MGAKRVLNSGGKVLKPVGKGVSGLLNREMNSGVVIMVASVQGGHGGSPLV